MLADALSETVVFELFEPSRAERLCERLRPRWHADYYECDDIVLVAAELRPRQDDLAILLRAVKLWLLDDRLGALRFHLDGRAFVLESDPALLRAGAA
jgi:hypothetical protein